MTVHPFPSHKSTRWFQTATDMRRPGKLHIAKDVDTGAPSRSDTRCGLWLWPSEHLSEEDVHLNAALFCKRCLSSARIHT